MINGIVIAQWVNPLGWLCTEILWEDHHGYTTVEIAPGFVTQAVFDPETNYIWFK